MQSEIRPFYIATWPVYTRYPHEPELPATARPSRAIISRPKPGKSLKIPVAVKPPQFHLIRPRVRRPLADDHGTWSAVVSTLDRHHRWENRSRDVHQRWGQIRRVRHTPTHIEWTDPLNYTQNLDT
jgi:hypothetical protein